MAPEPAHAVARRAAVGGVCGGLASFLVLAVLAAALDEDPWARLGPVEHMVTLGVTGAWCALLVTTVALVRRARLEHRPPLVVAVAAGVGPLLLWVGTWVHVLLEGKGPVRALAELESTVESLWRQYPAHALAFYVSTTLPFVVLGIARARGPLRGWREGLLAALGGVVAAASHIALDDAPPWVPPAFLAMPLAACLGLRLADRLVDRLFPPPPAEGDAPAGPAIG